MEKLNKKVILACGVCGSRNYATAKKQDGNERLALKKFCKSCGTHTIHRETK